MSAENKGAAAPAGAPSLASLVFYPQKNPKLRLFALWYFCTLMIAWNIVGRIWLGFEQSWFQALAGIGTAVFMQFLLEWVDARANKRKPRYSGSVGNLVNFLPPPLIAGFACGMLLFPNEHVFPIAFAACLAIGSKVLFRAPVGNGQSQHVFNPSNLGVVVTLFTLPWVGIAPPYHFTNTIEGSGNVTIPLIIMLTGLFLHWKFTGRLPLLLGWLGGFALQAVIRAKIGGAPWYVPLTPMSSAAFVLFTNYMIPDPATTPIGTRAQIFFGLAVAMVYGILFMLHIVFALFLSLVVVCAARGIYLHIADRLAAEPEPSPSPAGIPA